MTAPIAPAQRAAVYLARVERDTTLDANFRRIVPALRRLASTEPSLAIERLQTAAELYLPGVGRFESATALARSVSAHTFWEFHLDAAIKAAFRTAEDYVRYMNTRTDASSMLDTQLSHSPTLVPASHSWLTRARDVEGLSAADVISALNVTQEPPLVIFYFEVADMVSSSLTIRKPCSLDSVLGNHLQWSAAGLPSGAEEYLDGDVPRAAITRMEWLR